MIYVNGSAEHANAKNGSALLIANEPAIGKRTYTVREIAEILSLKSRTAYDLCAKTNDFKIIKIGRNIRIDKASFDAWFAS